ncbi:RDD family protein [Actinophytocola sp. KF-1]
MSHFADGTPFARAGDGRRFAAWLIDFVVFVLLYAVAFVALALVDRARPLDDDVVTVIALALLFVVPLLYGLFFAGGRALGGVLTGTRLVRARDGRRPGWQGPWVMLVRTILLPLLIVAVVVSNASPAGELKRICVVA